jgi:hypothetical protein
MWGRLGVATHLTNSGAMQARTAQYHKAQAMAMGTAEVHTWLLQ